MSARFNAELWQESGGPAPGRTRPVDSSTAEMPLALYADGWVSPSSSPPVASTLERRRREGTRVAAQYGRVWARVASAVSLHVG